MKYTIQFKSGKVITLHHVTAVDYYNGNLYVSDGEATYTFSTEEILYSEYV